MTDSPPRLQMDRDFVSWLMQEQISLAFTTYQTNWLAFLGVDPQGRISAFQRQFPRAMGLFSFINRLYLGTRYQIWQLDNVLSSGQLYQGYDTLYVPRIGHTTGDLDTHDVAVDDSGRILFIATRLNCLATLSQRHSCTPLWHPPFISQVINEDRCHLNGLAMVAGQPSFVTVCSRSDVVDGWRDRRADGGCILEVPSGEVVVSGLSMPHSPRFYQGKLWVLNSGTGDFGYVDLDRGRFEPVSFCPGYGRGLAFHQDYAIVGLSQARDATFAGLGLEERLAAKDGEARCGLVVIDLKRGSVVHWLRIEGTITELYDVAVLAQGTRPMAIGLQTDEIAQVLTLDPISN